MLGLHLAWFVDLCISPSLVFSSVVEWTYQMCLRGPEGSYAWQSASCFLILLFFPCLVNVIPCLFVCFLGPNFGKPSMNKEGYANLVQNIHVKIIPSVICQKKESWDKVLSVFYNRFFKRRSLSALTLWIFGVGFILQLFLRKQIVSQSRVVHV